MSNSETQYCIPKGFFSYSANIGNKPSKHDFVCVYSPSPCVSDAVFTQSTFAGPSVQISREHIAKGGIQAFVTLSGNANVATGAQGEANAREIINICARHLQIDDDRFVIASTGVIGRPYPMEKIRNNLEMFSTKMSALQLEDAAKAIMTTDTRPKFGCESIGNSCLAGIAKGVGMIEPNMATLIVSFFSDAHIEQDALRDVFRRVMDRTFNCVSVDTDTSTSDTAVILANGRAGAVDHQAFEQALLSLSEKLVKQIAIDGEGATCLIEVTVNGASSYRQAKRIAKAIVNSPLVKTAIHGKDPNWGRITMAIGKCHEEHDIVPSQVTIRFRELKVYPTETQDLQRLKEIMHESTVPIIVDLNLGMHSATVWGCDLSAEYVRINSEYTT